MYKLNVEKTGDRFPCYQGKRVLSASKLKVIIKPLVIYCCLGTNQHNWYIILNHSFIINWMHTLPILDQIAGKKRQRLPNFSSLMSYNFISILSFMRTIFLPSLLLWVLNSKIDAHWLFPVKSPAIHKEIKLQSLAPIHALPIISEFPSLVSVSSSSCVWHSDLYLLPLH